jgi:hypothetical protein
VSISDPVLEFSVGALCVYQPRSMFAFRSRKGQRCRIAWHRAKTTWRNKAHREYVVQFMDTEGRSDELFCLVSGKDLDLEE